jgi:hypothetical protein
MAVWVPFDMLDLAADAYDDLLSRHLDANGEPKSRAERLADQQKLLQFYYFLPKLLRTLQTANWLRSQCAEFEDLVDKDMISELFQELVQMAHFSLQSLKGRRKRGGGFPVDSDQEARERLQAAVTNVNFELADLLAVAVQTIKTK